MISLPNCFHASKAGYSSTLPCLIMVILACSSFSALIQIESSRNLIYPNFFSLTNPDLDSKFYQYLKSQLPTIRVETLAEISSIANQDLSKRMRQRISRDQTSFFLNPSSRVQSNEKQNKVVDNKKSALLQAIVDQQKRNQSMKQVKEQGSNLQIGPISVKPVAQQLLVNQTELSKPSPKPIKELTAQIQDTNISIKGFPDENKIKGEANSATIKEDAIKAEKISIKDEVKKQNIVDSQKVKGLEGVRPSIGKVSYQIRRKK